MSKFCNNCGTQLDDQAQFCFNCGASFAAPQAAPQAPEAPAPQAAPKVNVDEIVNKTTAFVGDYVGKAKKDPKLFIIPVAAVAAVIALIILLSSALGAGYKKPLDNVVKLMQGKGSEKIIESMLPKEAWEFLEDEADLAVDDVFELYEDNIDDLVENLEDTYGENYKIKYKVTKEKELSERKVEDMAEALEELLDIDEKDVKKVYKLDLEVEISGKDDDDEEELEDVLVAKIGSKWYIVGAMGYDVSSLGYLMNMAGGLAGALGE